jgi:hypothetical protein
MLLFPKVFFKIAPSLPLKWWTKMSVHYSVEMAFTASQMGCAGT